MTQQPGAAGSATATRQAEIPDRGESETDRVSVLGAELGRGQPVSEPAFFSDLNLDQLVDAIADANERYELAAFFRTPLHDPDQVEYRHELQRDLERDELLAAVQRFVAAMHEMRDRLALADKLHDGLQRQRWFLAAVETYCSSVEALEAELIELAPQSEALRSLCSFVARYRRDEPFTRLAAETAQLIDDLQGVSYSVTLKGLQVIVDDFADQPDLTRAVEDTFARFRESPAKSYRVGFPDHADTNTVESRILALVAELNPEVFERLTDFCQRHADYLHPTIARFDREIHFYLGYLDYIAPLRTAGVSFCLPTVSTQSKNIRATDACDVVLARKLLEDGGAVVVNDFELTGRERILVITGPNQGGKTTFSRMFGQLHHLAALGLPVPARDATLYLPDRVFTHFEREENISTLRSKFEEELVRIHEILEAATDRSLLIMNESFGSTTAGDALLIGRRVLERVLALDMLCVCVTFIDELSSLSERTVSMMSTVDADDLTRRTFKVIRKPADGLAYAVALAERHGLGYQQLKRRIMP